MHFEPGGETTPLKARPTAFAKFGTSYLFRTSLALGHKLHGAIAGYDLLPPHTEHGPSELDVLVDGNGSWHGGIRYEQKRFNALMGDGHLVSQNATQYQRSWSYLLDLLR